MEKEKLHLGDAVVCHVKEDMEAPFTGKIEKVYENSALLSITDYADKDRQNAAELNFKIVANFHAMTQNLGRTSRRAKKINVPITLSHNITGISCQ